MVFTKHASLIDEVLNMQEVLFIMLSISIWYVFLSSLAGEVEKVYGHEWFYH